MARLFYLPDGINKLYSGKNAIYLLHSTPITVIIMAHVYIARMLKSDYVHYTDIVNDLEEYFETLERTFLEEKEFGDKFKLAQDIFRQEMTN